jgi:hypothetical protein
MRPRFEDASLLRVVDHRHADAVLDAPSGFWFSSLRAMRAVPSLILSAYTRGDYPPAPSPSFAMFMRSSSNDPRT